MDPLEKTAERYRQDPAFHAVVDVMIQSIVGLSLSPSEVREAAMYACFLVEMRYPRPIAVMIDPSEDPFPGPAGKKW